MTEKQAMMLGGLHSLDGKDDIKRCKITSNNKKWYRLGVYLGIASWLVVFVIACLIITSKDYYILWSILEVVLIVVLEYLHKKEIPKEFTWENFS